MAGDASGVLDTAVRSFIHDHIDSVEALEVLLYMASGAARHASFSAAEVSRELRGDEASIERRLQSQVRAALLETLVLEGVARFRFAPADPSHCELCEKLAACYRERRYRVINCIFDKPIDKLRTFANAFRYKGDK